MFTKHSYQILGHYIQDKTNALHRRYHSEEEMVQRINQVDDHYLGSLERDGLLQEELNRNHQNILEDLKNDYPRFTRKRVLVFSLTAAGIPNELIRQRAQLPYLGSLYTMKYLMIQQIESRNSPRKKEYLKMLGRE